MRNARLRGHRCANARRRGPVPAIAKSLISESVQLKLRQAAEMSSARRRAGIDSRRGRAAFSTNKAAFSERGRSSPGRAHGTLAPIDLIAKLRRCRIGARARDRESQGDADRGEGCERGDARPETGFIAVRQQTPSLRPNVRPRQLQLDRKV